MSRRYANKDDSICLAILKLFRIKFARTDKLVPHATKIFIVLTFDTQMGRYLAFILVAMYAAHCCGKPVGRIISEMVDGVSDTFDRVDEGFENITDVFEDGMIDAQKEFNNLVEERVDFGVDEAVQLNEGLLDTAVETISGVRDTANAVDGYWDDNMKHAGMGHVSIL